MSVIHLIDKAAEKCGTRYKLAQALGVAPAQVYDWREGRKPCSPADQARIAAFAGEDALQQLVRATIDQAKGDVRREQLVKVLGKLSHQTGAALVGVLPSLASLSFLIELADRHFIRCIDSLNRYALSRILSSNTSVVENQPRKIAIATWCKLAA